MKADRAIGNAFVGCALLVAAGAIVVAIVFLATVVKVWWP